MDSALLHLCRGTYSTVYCTAFHSVEDGAGAAMAASAQDGAGAGADASVGTGDGGKDPAAGTPAVESAVALKVLKKVKEYRSVPGVHPDFLCEASVVIRLAKDMENNNVACVSAIAPFASVLRSVRYESTLRHMIPLERPDAALFALPSESAARVTRDVLVALEAAHGHGIAHHDIKPGNIFLDATAGVARLGDWGIAGVMSTPCEPDDVRDDLVYTTPYRPPECILSHARSRLTGTAVAEKLAGDVWALGTTLVEMLGGDILRHELSTDDLVDWFRVRYGVDLEDADLDAEPFDTADYREGPVWQLQRTRSRELVGAGAPPKGHDMVLHPHLIDISRPSAELRRRYARLLRHVSPELNDFLWQSLRVLPRRRAAAKDLRCHPWIVKHGGTLWTCDRRMVEKANASVLSVDKRAPAGTEAQLLNLRLEEAEAARERRPVVSSPCWWFSGSLKGPDSWHSLKDAYAASRMPTRWNICLEPEAGAANICHTTRGLCSKVASMLPPQHVSRLEQARWVLAALGMAWSLPAREARRWNAVSLCVLAAKQTVRVRYLVYVVDAIMSTGADLRLGGHVEARDGERDVIDCLGIGALPGNRVTSLLSCLENGEGNAAFSPTACEDDAAMTCDSILLSAAVMLSRTPDVILDALRKHGPARVTATRARAAASDGSARLCAERDTDEPEALPCAKRRAIGDAAPNNARSLASRRVAGLWASVDVRTVVVPALASFVNRPNEKKR